MRIFLDTNVLASGLMGRGLCHDLLDRILIEHVVLLGAPVHEELFRILTAKFHVPTELWRQIETALDALERTPSVTTPLATPIPDPDDAPILACALAALADIFVTGDKALLGIRKIDNMPIVSPRQLWQLLSGIGG